jgi:anti-sigma regulatory factor (Ser/Thr protein kinase)
VGDRDRLIQVFGNLVSNAIKYTPAGEVGVSARPTYGAVEVVVHDTGVGMTPEEQRQLFTKFFRSRDRTGHDPGGTGLGLVIAKGIVEGHGGALSVESEPGVGTALRSRLGTYWRDAQAGRDRASWTTRSPSVFLSIFSGNSSVHVNGVVGSVMAHQPDLIILDGDAADEASTSSA